MTKEADAFRTISEVAEILGIPQHVLRFWELKFPQINPLKRAGGRRYYRPGEVALLGSIRDLLYADGYTIKGVQRLLREQGVRAVSGMAARLKMPADQLRSESSPDAAHDVDPNIYASTGKFNEGELGTRIDALAAEIDECAAILSAAAVAAERASSF